MKKYLLSFSVLVFGFLFFSNVTFGATTSILYPIANGTYGSWSGGVTRVDESGVPNCSAGNSITEMIPGNRESYVFDLSSVPNNSLIDSIDVTVASRGNVIMDGGKFKLFTRVNNSNTDSSSEISVVGTGVGSDCNNDTENFIFNNLIKDSFTTLEIGVLKTDLNPVRVGAINIVINYTQLGSLTVNKNVLNPENSEVVDNQSFSIMLNGSNTQNISENSSYTYTNLTPGVYTITENSNGNYDFVSFSTDNDNGIAGAQVVVSAGNNTVLTITNKQKSASLTVNKIVTNPNGGEAVAGDFSFKVNDGEAVMFTQDENNPLLGSNTLTLNPGTYTITEVMPEGSYAISYQNCTSINLTSNGNATCTITNSDIPEGKGAITVVKSLNLNYNGSLTANDFDLFINDGEANTEVSSGSSNFLNPGNYIISEGSLPAGYVQNSISCTNGVETNNGSISLSEQASWVCTITNSDTPAKLKIVKKVINTALYKTLEDTFNFNLTGNEAISINTAMPEGEFNSEEYNAIGESEILILNAGEYNLTENLNPNWNLTNVSCSGEEGMEIENGVALSLQNGEEVICTFTNTRKVGTLIVEKVVVNDDNKEYTISDFPGFTINNNSVIPFDSNEDNMSGGKTVILELGTYQISEPVTEGYYKVTENCDSVNIIENESKTCKFRNDDVGFFVHSGGSGGSGGQVLGATTEEPTTTTEETPTMTEETKPEGEVLGETTCAPYITKYMRYRSLANDKNEVTLLQKFLNEYLNLDPKLKEDGIFGLSTRNAVIAFQEKHKDEVLTPWVPFGLKGDKGTGNVYKTTLRMVNKMKCPNTEIPMPKLP